MKPPTVEMMRINGRKTPAIEDIKKKVARRIYPPAVEVASRKNEKGEDKPPCCANDKNKRQEDDRSSYGRSGTK